MKSLPLRQILSLVLIFIAVPLFTQMPDWKFFRDREGNRYYIDKTFKIWTSGKPEFKYRAVSNEGIDYYLNQGLQLIKSGYRLEGVTLLKSILSMPDDNNRIYKAQVSAAKKINFLKLREGFRFEKLDLSTSLLLYKTKSDTFILNDFMFYRFKHKGRGRVVRYKIRKRYNNYYSGLLIGINTKYKLKKRNKGYDFLIAVDSERFFIPLRDIDVMNEHWAMVLGAENISRKKLQSNNEKIIYSFNYRGDPPLSGFEGIFHNNKFGYIVRVITPASNSPKYRKLMKSIITDFKFIEESN